MILDKVALILKEAPQVRRVQIEGYTSAEGGVDQNRKLSEDRARSVMLYLIEHGVAKDRLVARGFGPDNPIAPNDTELNREKNRRVVFNVVDQAEH
jgi:OOP family OmpA-OmpF porin